MDAPPKYRKVYARGLFDGLRKAGIVDVEGFMNAAKMKQVESGLTSIARKVLDAVPKTDAWASAAILGEIKRATGSNYEMKLINGCLESLKASGLVREPVRGKWIRIAVKDHDDEAVEVANVVELRKLPDQPTAREMLSQVAIAMMDLAAKVEDVANEIDKAEKRNDEKTAKLRQLQELLRGLGQ